MGSNRILPIIGGLVLMMLLFVGVKSCNQDPQDSSQLVAVPTPGSPDADSPADTIRTLTAEVASIKNESKKLAQQNEDLLRQRNDIEAQVKAKVLQEMQAQQDKKESPLEGLTQKLDFFKSRLDELSTAQNNAAIQSQMTGDIPVGFGLGQESLQESLQEVIWVEPLGTQNDAQGNPLYSAVSNTRSQGGLLNSENKIPGITEKYLTPSDKEFEEYRPEYTVPRNSTLIGSTGMTALIGRIPRNGTVEEPFPFKVIVGKDNLAANGIEIPGLDGMIFSGKATGDWTLSCVRGGLHSVTYVFADGTIKTLSSDDQSQISQAQGQGRGQSNDRDLGWISDRRGIPCVTGVRISNAATYLSGRILASAAEAAAGAFSQNEVTNTVSALGGVSTSVITGDALKFAGGKALAGGASEVSDYLRERGAQAFDVIYVDTGVELAIHVDVELPIDYEYQGRKTSYVYNENTDYDDLD